MDCRKMDDLPEEYSGYKEQGATRTFPLQIVAAAKVSDSPTMLFASVCVCTEVCPIEQFV